MLARRPNSYSKSRPPLPSPLPPFMPLVCPPLWYTAKLHSWASLHPSRQQLAPPTCLMRPFKPNSALPRTCARLSSFSAWIWIPFKQQATLRGDIRDLRRLTVSPADLQTGFANFVQDMELQLRQQNRSAVEQAQAVRNVQAQFNSLREQLYGRVHDMRTFLDQRLLTLESSFAAHQQATEQPIRSL